MSLENKIKNNNLKPRPTLYALPHLIRLFLLHILFTFVCLCYLPLLAWNPGWPLGSLFANAFHDYNGFCQGFWFGFSCYSAVLAILSTSCLTFITEKDWEEEHYGSYLLDLKGFRFPIPQKSFWLASACLLPGWITITTFSETRVWTFLGTGCGALLCLGIVLGCVRWLQCSDPKFVWVCWSEEDTSRQKGKQPPGTTDWCRGILFALVLWFNKCTGMEVLRHLADEEQRLKREHFMAFVFAVVVSLIYTAFYWLLKSETIMQSPFYQGIPPAAFFYALLTPLVWYLSFFRSYLGRYRLVLPTFLSFFFLFNSISQVPYTYDVHPAKKDTVQKNPSLTKVDVQKHFQGFVKKVQTKDPSKTKTIYLVAASGGGILASTWTAHVLTALEEKTKQQRTGSKFRKNLLLISSVSGGSIGTAHYIQSRKYDKVINEKKVCQAFIEKYQTLLLDKDMLSLQGKCLTDDCRCTRALASISSLRSTLHGIAFPDFIKTIFPFFTITQYDRGRLLEQSWRRKSNQALQSEAKNGGLHMLSSYVKPIKDYKIPGFIFNTTVLGTGERIAITPFASFHGSRWRGRVPENQNIGRFVSARTLSELLQMGPDEGKRYCHTLKKECKLGKEKCNAYKQYCKVKNQHLWTNAIDLWTAARLSATFGYVSPAPTALAQKSVLLSDNKNLHLIDGGYHENYGVASIVNYLETALRSQKEYEAAPYQIALIEIRNTPDIFLKKEFRKTDAYNPQNTSHCKVKTKGKYRVTNPCYRSHKILDWKEKAGRKQRQYVDFLGPIHGIWNAWSHSQRSTNDALLHQLARNIESKGIKFRSFVFAYPQEGPLSWHLSKGQKQTIAKQWSKDVTIRSELKSLLDYISGKECPPLPQKKDSPCSRKTSSTTRPTTFSTK